MTAPTTVMKKIAATDTVRTAIRCVICMGQVELHLSQLAQHRDRRHRLNASTTIHVAMGFKIVLMETTKSFAIVERLMSSSVRTVLVYLVDIFGVTGLSIVQTGAMSRQIVHHSAIVIERFSVPTGVVCRQGSDVTVSTTVAIIAMNSIVVVLYIQARTNLSVILVHVYRPQHSVMAQLSVRTAQTKKKIATSCASRATSLATTDDACRHIWSVTEGTTVGTIAMKLGVHVAAASSSVTTGCACR